MNEKEIEEKMATGTTGAAGSERRRSMRGLRSHSGLRGLSGLMGLGSPISLMGLFSLILLICMGCSHEEIVEEPVPVPTPERVTPIAFSGSLSEEGTVTRAVTGLQDETTSFKVWAYKNTSVAGSTYGDAQAVMLSYIVNWQENTAATTTTNSNGWEYAGQGADQTVKYWDWSAKAYRFFGVAGGSGGVLPDVVVGTAAVTVTIAADATSEDYVNATPFYSHLWFSNNNYETYPDREYGKPVKLEFLKPFAKVRFKFIFENPDDAKDTELTGKSFRPTAPEKTILRKGTVTVTYPLTGIATKESVVAAADENTGTTGTLDEFTQDYYEVTTEAGETVYPYRNAGTGESTVYNVLPATDQGTYTLSVSVNGSELKTAVVPAEFMNWLPGYQYTYIFKVHVDGGVTIDTVQSAFTPWTIVENNHTVYNW